MKEKYTAPKAEVIEFGEHDIITASQPTSSKGGIELPDDVW